ncbi:putative hydro-lyase [Rhizobium calliandrae]|uniref:Putative hydro-lyase PY650_25350 n=1 Tax=Rhizobium calliandrae TaxID=1312182 RepID=A0ABT7KJU1_9HYPH|nr:putative hydro-lyase [Rhizobium calliandrae]MDL2408900.1 putative hydro-lyase [Rhizobium calliandrae]
MSSTAPSSALRIRLMARAGVLSGPTANLAPGFVQANLAILPCDLAYDFLLFCQRNPKPCPLLGVAEAGATSISGLGDDLDIRTDVPRYRVWKKGVLVDELQDVTRIWREDFVTFAIGCSFSFEEALQRAGVPVRHIEEGLNVPMFRSSIATTPSGAFSGPLVVSMRPMIPEDAIKAVQITGRFPSVHGAPVHLGDPEAIGIKDIASPDYGDAVTIRPGEIPVFWACGVTPQAAIGRATPELSITHAPGHMLLTDMLNATLSIQRR